MIAVPCIDKAVESILVAFQKNSKSVLKLIILLNCRIKCSVSHEVNNTITGNNHLDLRILNR